MQSLKSFIVVILFITIFSACGMSKEQEGEINEENGDDNIQTTLEERDVINEDSHAKEHTNELVTEEEQQSYMAEQLMASYFTEVEIEVEYGDGIEYEVEIEQDNSFIKAKIDDEINDQKIKGIEAFNYIYERMEQLELTTSSRIETVAEQIISLFDLPGGYEEIEVEVKFQNGSKLKLEDKVH